MSFVSRVDLATPGHVVAPATGAVIAQAAVGDEVTAPISGRIERIAFASGIRVERGVLLLILAYSRPPRRRPEPYAQIHRVFGFVGCAEPGASP